MEKRKEQWIMVMGKGPTQEEFGLHMAYSVDVFGAEVAMEKANEYMDELISMFRDCEFKLKGGAW